MRKKQFKAESQKLLDMMIHSIYTHKEIFLRELISNASDALDKLYFRSLTDTDVGLKREDFRILLAVDKAARTLTISDNGCGMTEQELEQNLGTIAKSGSNTFKQENEKAEDVEIIGQFGVGFYSAFMVSDKVEVRSRAYGAEEAFLWTSDGVDGYTIQPDSMDTAGTVITLHIKENTENEHYDEFLEPHRIAALVKKYSDYIHYPIRMEMEESRPKEGAEGEYETVTELKTLNSMVPLWRKNKSEITEEEYNRFYKEKFMDYSDPLRVIHSKTEGQVTYDALLYIPSHAPYDYYTKDFKKGLALYSGGVMIMEQCADLLPDYYSFVKGLVDSADLSLNISRELLQHDHQLKLIAKNIEKKIHSELKKMLDTDREKYETLWKAFGIQIKFGVYNDFGMHKDNLKDLLLFYSMNEKKLVTLEEYIAKMPEEQKEIYYACGETNDKIAMLPQLDAVRDKGYDALFLTENVDEFCLQVLGEFKEKKFHNVCAGDLELGSTEETDALKARNEAAKDLFAVMKEALGERVTDIRFTNKLKEHPVCLVSEGGLSVDMEKVLNSMPTNEKVKARVILEINAEHPIAARLEALKDSDPETLKKYTQVLFTSAQLISGLSCENPTEFSRLVCELML